MLGVYTSVGRPVYVMQYVCMVVWCARVCVCVCVKCVLMRVQCVCSFKAK
jgi:hypothetical protein